MRASKFDIDWRLRQETVEQDGIPSSANAVTSRLRAGVTTGAFRATSLQMEAVYVEDIVDDYNSTLNGNVGYPVVADPDITAVNRFAFINKSLPKTTLTLGRQRIILDDHRFVGNVGWRQNEQTYDALRAVRTGEGVKMDVTYADQVNRVFGPESPAGKWHGDVVLANFALPMPVGTLTFFGYLLDFEDAVAASSNTVGARLTGSKPIGSLTGLYTLSYAAQEDAGSNPASIGEHSYLLEGGLRIAKLTASLGYEVLSGNGTVSFQTPLATLHAFQGWADKFLATPVNGIENPYLKLGYRAEPLGPFKSVAALAVLHEFNAEVGSAHYGDELDLQLVAQTERLTFMIKYATYDADELHTNTDKFWVSMEYAF
ncbi:MAG TPA: hypothetical protein VIM81_14465 [Gammaproteobacteria bacterium]